MLATSWGKAAAGAGMEHIVRLNAYVTGREHLPGYMKARDAALGQLPPTASTLMMVSGFARPEFVVEVEALAAIASAGGGGGSAGGGGGVVPPTPASTPASVRAAASGRRGLHTRSSSSSPRSLLSSQSPSLRLRRRLHGKRVEVSRVDALVAELKAANVQVRTLTHPHITSLTHARLTHPHLIHPHLTYPHLTHPHLPHSPISASHLSSLLLADVQVLCGSSGDANDKREIARRSRDFFWCSPQLPSLRLPSLTSHSRLPSLTSHYLASRLPSLTSHLPRLLHPIHRLSTLTPRTSQLASHLTGTRPS